MKILHRYIFRTVMFSTLFVLAALLVLMVFMAFTDELGDVGVGHYRTRDAFFFSLLQAPGFVFEIFPVSALIGSLLGLGTLASHSELVAMRAAGVSIGRVVWSVVRAGLWMLLAVALIGEYVAPPAERMARQMKAERMNEQVLLQSNFGFWAKDGRDFVNIRQILPGNRLGDIFIYRIDDRHRLTHITVARRAVYDNKHWELAAVQSISLSEQGLRIEREPRVAWNLLLKPSLLRAVVIDPVALPVSGLHSYITYLRASHQDARPFEVAFWSRIATPLVTVVMLVLAVPFVFGSLRSTGIGPRLFLGVVIGLAFYTLNRAFTFMALVYHLNTPLMVLFPGLLVLAWALWLLRLAR